MKLIKCKSCKGEGYQGLCVSHPDDRGKIHTEMVSKYDCNICEGTGIIIEQIPNRKYYARLRHWENTPNTKTVIINER